MNNVVSLIPRLLHTGPIAVPNGLQKQLCVEQTVIIQVGINGFDCQQNACSPKSLQLICKMYKGSPRHDFHPLFDQEPGVQGDTQVANWFCMRQHSLIQSYKCTAAEISLLMNQQPFYFVRVKSKSVSPLVEAEENPKYISCLGGTHVAILNISAMVPLMKWVVSTSNFI